MARRSINSSEYAVPIDGFSQIVTVPSDAEILFVSGLTSRKGNGTIVGVGDMNAQMRQIFSNLTTILASAGADSADVVSIRTYVTDIDQWSSFEPLWREYWGNVWPASTLVQIGRLFDERQLVEMEVTVALPSGKKVGVSRISGDSRSSKELS